MLICGSDLLASLRDGSLPPAEFNHTNHLRAAWLILHDHPLPEAAEEFRAVLQAYVRRLGAEDKFHRTLTDALLYLLRDRMTQCPGDWPAFQARNPDLFENAKSLLARHYSPVRLDSAEARMRFVEPDREPLPHPAQGTAKR